MNEPEPTIVHVHPTFGMKHICDDTCECWCEPQVEETKGGGVVVVHNVDH